MPPPRKKISYVSDDGSEFPTEEEASHHNRWAAFLAAWVKFVEIKLTVEQDDPPGFETALKLLFDNPEYFEENILPLIRPPSEGAPIPEELPPPAEPPPPPVDTRRPLGTSKGDPPPPPPPPDPDHYRG